MSLKNTGSIYLPGEENHSHCLGIIALFINILEDFFC